MRILTILFVISLMSCATHRIELKPIDIYGSNEQPIPEPELR